MIFWLIILGVVGLVSWAVVAAYKALVLQQVKSFKDKTGNVMKGSPPTFLIGDFLRDYFSPPSLESKSFLTYGDIYYRWFFWKPTVMVVDHQAVDRVLNNNDTYRKNTPAFAPYSRDNTDMQNQSEAVKSVFNAKNLDILGEAVVDMAQDLSVQLVNSQGSGNSFDVFKTCEEFTREAMGTVLFGDTFSARQIMTAQRDLSGISTFRAVIRSSFPNLAKMAPSFFGIEQASELSAGLTEAISKPAPNTTLAFLKKQHNKQEGGKEAEESETDSDEETQFERHHKEQLGDAVADRDEDEQESLKLKQVVSNIIGFYTSGLDTTASILTSVIYMLMKHQDIQQNLREEIKKTLDGSSITYSKIRQVKLLTFVIKETLRLHPPYPILYPRVAIRNDKLGGFHIPAQTKIIIDVIGHNRHPSYWTRPDSFEPNRFTSPKASKYVLAWGSGPQEKVGRTLGMLVLRSTIATLLLKYNIVADSPSNLKGVKFERTVGSLHPSPPLIARVDGL